MDVHPFSSAQSPQLSNMHIYADCCPQGLLHASRGYLGSGRVHALAVKAGSCTTTDEYRLLQGAASVLPQLVSLRVDFHRLYKPYDADFLPPASDSPHVQHAAQSVQLPASVIAPIVPVVADALLVLLLCRGLRRPARCVASSSRRGGARGFVDQPVL